MSRAAGRMSGAEDGFTQDGFTLAETLAALLILGLAIGGLGQALMTIGRMQTAAGRAVGEARVLRAGSQALVQTVDGPGLFRPGPGALTGDAQRFSLDCGKPAPCGASLYPTPQGTRISFDAGDGQTRSLVLPRVQAAFAYEESGASGDRWPPADATPGGPRRSLRAVVLVAVTSTGQRALARAPVWTDQAADCAFDPIAQACRKTDG
jgi:prepilin-type N-terminal cleavage/methylation domain-containing protein